VINKEKEKDMNRITRMVPPTSEGEQPISKQRSRFLSMMWVVWLIALLSGVLPGTVLAGDDQDHDDATLVGTWRTRIVFPGPPNEFFSLEVFNKGGTMTDRFSSGPGLSVSSGVWKKIPGRGNFAATLEAFTDTNSDGFFDRRVRIRLTIHLLDHESFTATATTQALTLDGSTPLFPPVPGVTVQGTRMHVIPE
jgi:hypothetical protein